MTKDQILSTPIGEAEFSKDFSERCKLMGFETVAEIVYTAPYELIKKRGFSYTWLGELIEFLNKYQALHLMQPIPGKSHG